MQIDFKSSKTKENLMKAFAGESQARNRYTFAASLARAQKLQVIEMVFNYTAGQEKEHAEIFYGYLNSMAGETINIEGGYPVDITNSISQLLRMAQHNEFEESDDVYKAFGDTAKEEGFGEIANVFYSIAQIEKTHGERFQKFAELLEQGKLFVSDVSCKWVCLNCGHIIDSKDAPKMCPVCKHDQGYFIREKMAPYTE